MASYLRQRKGHFYLRVRVPSHLLHVIPAPEILKSLHTKNLKFAKLSVSTLLPSILEVFTLSRIGFISETQARERLNIVLRRNPKKEDSPVAGHPVAIPPSPDLSQVIKEFSRDKSAKWTGKTALEYRSYFKLLLDIIGTRPVAEISRADIRNVRDTLSRLPAHLYKKHPNRSIEEVLRMENISPMSTTTVNKLLTLLGSIMIHCIKEGYRRDNPVEGLKIQRRRRPDEERKTYTPQELQKIVVALPQPTEKPERYWIPLIGMFSGMRLGEICGLHINDVKQVEGIWCFDVNEENGRRLKNLNSKRLVPIHPHLLDQGFLAHVQSLQVQGELRLWPNLDQREIDGYCHQLGNWYGRFNRKYITMDPLKTFHSLRHTFADTLKQNDVAENAISELLGHANCSITTGRYGKKYRPEALLRALQKLNYGIGR